MQVYHNLNRLSAEKGQIVNYFDNTDTDNFKTTKMTISQKYTQDTMFVIGDSHTDIFNKNTWHQKKNIWKNELNFLLYVNTENIPNTVTFHLSACTAYNSNKQISTVHTLEKTQFLIKNGFLPKGATVVTVFGEIDCRVHIAKVADEKHLSVEQVIDDIIRNYGEYLSFLKLQGYNVIAYGPICTQSDSCPLDVNFPRYGTEIERNKITSLFNQKLENFCKEHSIGFKTLFYNLVNEDMTTKQEYLLDTDHVHLAGNAYPMLEELFSDVHSPNKKQEKVAICMPVYNTQKEHLKEAIESILKQTFQDFKIFIYDDGSDAIDIKSVVDEFNSDKIVYHKNQQKQGVAAARNEILNVIESEYVRFFDADEIMPEDALEKQVNYLDTHPETGILGGAAECLGDTKNICKFRQKVNYLDIYIPKIQINAAMARAKLIKDNNIRFSQEVNIAEDYQFFSDAIRIMSVENLEDIVLLHRVQPNSAETGKDFRVVQQNILDFLTADKNFQKDIEKSIILHSDYKLSELKYNNFLEKIFSVKNQYKCNLKYRKVVTVFGIKMKFTLYK